MVSTLVVKMKPIVVAVMSVRVSRRRVKFLMVCSLVGFPGVGCHMLPPVMSVRIIVGLGLRFRRRLGGE